MITRKQKTVLTCAITGGVTTKENTPYLPCTPQEIATSALEAAEAGASIVHLHAREDDGKPSISLEKYRETVELIRKENSKLIINLTTGPGAKFIPDNTRLIAGRPESTMLPAGRRVRGADCVRGDHLSLAAGREAGPGAGAAVRVMAYLSARGIVKSYADAGARLDIVAIGHHIHGPDVPHALDVVAHAQVQRERGPQPDVVLREGERGAAPGVC